MGEARRRTPRASWALAAVLALGSVLVPTSAATGQKSAAEPPGTPAEAKRSVTLVTGDRLLLSGPDLREIGVVPGAGRTGVTFSTHRRDNRLEVIPSDVEPLVRSGRLDRRLFDVTGLLAAGYDDKATSSIPLIVRYAATAGRGTVRSAGATATRELPAIKGAAVRVPKAKAAGFVRALPVAGGRFGGGIDRIWLDGRRRVDLDRSVPQIGAPAAWSAGYTGSGVTVAVLDTGVDKTHPDLAGQVLEATSFTGGNGADGHGHGTHVASTIAGTGAASGGRYKGVAPAAKLLSGQVCDSFGCPESAIVAGMQWAATERHADVVNMSLGGPDDPGQDPLEEAVETLTAQTGTLFVVAAGNEGPAKGSIGSPGSADAALTVGAVNHDDALASFSSRGPRIGDGAIKPDLTAPGVGIVAARANAPAGEPYRAMSGTSMATPHVAGAAALLAQRHPDWTGPELKAMLTGSAKPVTGQTVFEQGSGRVDVARAVTQQVLAQPGKLSFGTATWPHDDDEPVTRQLTYRNTAASPVTLQLTADLIGPDGQPAPAGALSLGAGSLTVPAGATATVAVVSNTRHAGPDGVYTGRVTASGPDGLAITTPLMLTREGESYSLTITHLGRDGKPAPDAWTSLDGLDFDAQFRNVNDADGTVTVRVPKGRYLLDSSLGIPVGESGVDLHRTVAPALMVGQDLAITVDARRTKQVRTTVPRPDAKPRVQTVSYEIVASGRYLSNGQMALGDDQRIFTAPLGESLQAPDTMTALVSSMWAPPEPRFNPAYTYQLVNTQRGRMFHGLDRVARDSELARVLTAYHAQADGRQADHFMFGRPDHVIGSVWAMNMRYDLPGRATHYVDVAATWHSTFYERKSEFEDVGYLESSRRRYDRGRQYPQRWNAAVIVPNWKPFFQLTRTAVRVGDRVGIVYGTDADQENAGFSLGGGGSSTLYADGVAIPWSPEGYQVPAGPAGIRYEASMNRSSRSKFSTRIDSAWTFRSDTASAEGEPLPVWALGYRPAVDELNTVTRTPVSTLPVVLTPNAGAEVGTIKTVTLQASGDDGQTWIPAKVRRLAENQYVADFPTPAGASFVSLRTKATDSAGNAIEQTVIRAYGLR